MFEADDDDLDFAPNAGSKLANVFSNEKIKENGNTSLVYTPPKKPKPVEQPIEMPPNSVSKTPAAVPRFSVIVADIVHSFKLDSGNYSDQRKVGVAVLGNAQAHVFQVLLYRTTSAGKQDYIAVAKVTNEFRFLVQPKFYCSFYDDTQHYWSLVFNCQDACMQFARQVGAARFRAIHGKSVVTQMIDPGDDGTSQMETTHLTISQQYFDVNSITPYMPKEATIKVSLNPSQAKWSEGLISASPGSKWAIFIPASTTLPWASGVSESPLVLEVMIEKMLQTSSTQAERAKEKITSGSEEGSGDHSLTESISNKSSSKANLISRVARLGQATLPLKGAAYYNHSDSEDTEEENSSFTSTNSAAKPPLKPKFFKGRAAGTQRSSESEPTYIPKAAAPVAGTLWRPPAVTSENKLVQYVSGDGKVVPMTPTTQQYQLLTTASAVTSPSEPMGMFISESRIQNTELRMNMNRIADKIDSLSTKVDSITNSGLIRPAASNATMDACPLALLNTLFGSIEKLVKDNQTLTAEVAEKNEKLKEFNEQSFLLVVNNSRIVEQNRILLEEKQKAAEVGDSQTFVVQKPLIEELENEKSTLLKRIAELETRLEVLETSNQDLNRSKTSELSAKDNELSAKIYELSLKDLELNDLRNSLSAKEVELNAKISEFDSFRGSTEQENKRVKEAEEKAKRFEDDNSELRDLVTSLSVNIIDLETTLTNLIAAHTKEKTAFENQKKTYEETIAQLKAQIEEPGFKNEVDFEFDLKLLMNKVFRKISGYFDSNSTVSGAVVRQTVGLVLKNEVTQYTEQLLLRKNSSVVKNVSADSDKAAPPVMKNPPVNATVPAVSPVLVPTESSAAQHPKREETEVAVEPSKPSEPPHSISNPAPNVSGAEEVRPRNEFWHSEPPPVPKFEDEEDNEDWLNM